MSISLVRYGVAILQKILEIRKKPQCNLECCLSVMQIAVDAGGDVKGVQRGCVTSNEQQWQDFELSSVQPAIRDDDDTSIKKHKKNV